MAATPTDAALARTYHHGDLRRALLEAAGRILVERGVVGLSLRALAREAGVSCAAPYHHFADKADLIGAVAQEGWRRLRQALVDAGAAPSVNRHAAIAEAYFRFSRENPALFGVMCDDAAAARSAPELLAAHKSAWAPVFPAGSDNKPDLGVLVALCAAHGLAELSRFAAFDAVRSDFGDDAALFSAFFATVAGLGSEARAASPGKASRPATSGPVGLQHLRPQAQG
ncbi:TetR/AcrR family transcriptional regulator [Caulobacter sp. KR2-114]|uniref:TetR/AcrR family transcriptional regulator n=1 Tax=Caulobacter sp. KR2-114 TaxID=3400912 RepID=UPI003C0B7BE1